MTAEEKKILFSVQYMMSFVYIFIYIAFLIAIPRIFHTKKIAKQLLSYETWFRFFLMIGSICIQTITLITGKERKFAVYFGYFSPIFNVQISSNVNLVLSLTQIVPNWDPNKYVIL